MNKVCTTTCIVSFVWVTPAFTWLNRSSILLSNELKQAPIFWSKELKQVSTFSARSICTNKLRVCTLWPKKLSDFHWVLQYKWLSWQCIQLTSLTWLKWSTRRVSVMSPIGVFTESRLKLTIFCHISSGQCFIFL
jgi:hypothetical protein